VTSIRSRISWFAPFWSWFDRLIEAGTIIAPDEVRVELEKKAQTALSQWLKARRDAFFQSHTEEVQAAFRAIMRTHPELTKKNKPESKSDGDAWVIAMAKVRAAVCVTEDKKRKGGTSFPLVCAAYGVEIIRLGEFIARENGK
jgi:Domain of unknown function (DUF4411)